VLDAVIAAAWVIVAGFVKTNTPPGGIGILVAAAASTALDVPRLTKAATDPALYILTVPEIDPTLVSATFPVEVVADTLTVLPTA